MQQKNANQETGELSSSYFNEWIDFVFKEIECRTRINQIRKMLIGGTLS